ncbi:LysR family transcriptional regulator [Companilactobacillus allii]|uniref:HTH lysR-type domain-containing protein n=1 Tax=Companilactobacillus allii TaxID=1847728 RepID=A0A1P8Q1R3_9LACO|nr:LysR family transcriptional regulator [Companilactobacillus allii]APX71729.1 hypothetical protein BTM29_03795 [Companilactobacillus allii]USQ68816.1 LysR family transcriptional regulator [Companilactobacillus allii]
MIDNYLLEELVTFSKAGTLMETAQMLHVTQPTITRGMQKLESELGAHLFDRQPNKITLTETGKMAAKEANKLIQVNESAITRIQNFDRNQRVIRIGSTLPGPLFVVNSIDLPSNIQVNDKQIESTTIHDALNHANYTLVLSNQNISNNTIDSQYIGTEQLAVNLNKFMIQANQTSIKFSELHDLSFVILSNIGLWRDIVQKSIPKAKFFYQEQQEAFSEITRYSDFPYFSTNILRTGSINIDSDRSDTRVRIPISDDNAKMPIYANYLKPEKTRVNVFIKQLISNWPADFD